MENKCSYCGKILKNHYHIGFTTTPTIYKCDRWWCTLLKKLKIYKIKYEK